MLVYFDGILVHLVETTITIRNNWIDSLTTEHIDVEEKFGHLSHVVIVFHREDFKLFTKDSGFVNTTYCPILGPQYQYTFGCIDYLRDGSIYAQND
jgi:hypothetical protein